MALCICVGKCQLFRRGVGTLIPHFKVFAQCSQHILFYNLNAHTKRIVVSSFFSRLFFFIRSCHFIPQRV